MIGVSLALRHASNRRAERPASFFESPSLITTPGTGLRRTTIESDAGEEPQKIPPFWSPHTDAKAIWGLLTGSWLNLMLVLVPLGYISAKYEWGATWTFSLVRSVPSACTLLPCVLLAVRFRCCWHNVRLRTGSRMCRIFSVSSRWRWCWAR